MANGRKEPWEQLGYIAGTGSRVVTQDPLSAITEAGADNFWKWLNNQTAYAKAAEQTEQAQKHQLERDKAQSKDAFKLSREKAIQDLDYLDKQFEKQKELKTIDTLKAEIDAIRAHSEKEPHGAYDRMETFLLREDLPEDIRKYGNSTLNLFQAKKDRQAERDSIVSEILPMVTVGGVQVSSKELQKRLNRTDKRGVPYFSPAEKWSFLNEHNRLVKTAGLTAGDVLAQSLRSASMWIDLNNERRFLKEEGGEDAQDQIKYIESRMKMIETSATESMMDGDYVKVSDKDAEGKSLVDQTIRKLAVDRGIVLADATEEETTELHNIASRIISDPSIAKKDIPPSALKKGNVVLIRRFDDPSEEKTISASEAKPLIDAGTWQYVKTVSLRMPKALGATPQLRSYPQSGVIPRDKPETTRFPRKVNVGYELQDADGNKYIIEHMVKEMGIDSVVDKAVLRNKETNERLKKKYSYDELVEKFRGSPVVP